MIEGEGEGRGKDKVGAGVRVEVEERIEAGQRVLGGVTKVRATRKGTWAEGLGSQFLLRPRAT